LNEGGEKRMCFECKRLTIFSAVLKGGGAIWMSLTKKQNQWTDSNPGKLWNGNSSPPEKNQSVSPAESHIEPERLALCKNLILNLQSIFWNFQKQNTIERR